ncbi:hypothetical protein EJ08DRAFT_702935 [Tothia fuscella]|uniref:BZIP domain-containing protein n=1 Tax=Tothia fuscella TaxID=1048955 RepID=A0A9P4TT22_9PEZI|nr:hypothetical protein EJ08DRAFT_702935 [Tothia fuscella]
MTSKRTSCEYASIQPRPRQAKPSPSNSREVWTHVTDVAERRRIQNRNAQREYRKRIKDRLEGFEKNILPGPDLGLPYISSASLPSTQATLDAMSTFSTLTYEEPGPSAVTSLPSYGPTSAPTCDVAFNPEEHSWQLLFPYSSPLPPWNSGSEYSGSSTDGLVNHYDEMFEQPLAPPQIDVCSTCGSCKMKSPKTSVPANVDFMLGTEEDGQYFMS